MFLHNYKYVVGTEHDGKSLLIPNINRDAISYLALKEHLNEYVQELAPTGSKQALVYIGGTLQQHSDVRNVKGTCRDYGIVIKTLVGNSIYAIARMFPKWDFEYVVTDGQTCASGLSSICTAKDLINKGFTDVVLYGVDLVEASQVLMFEQIGANVTCGDGAVVLHFSNKESAVEVGQTELLWNKDKSPMSVSKEGYGKLLSRFSNDYDIVKAHGSGTDANTEAELGAIGEDKRVVEYKSEIGHTQGLSGAIELCMLLEREKFNKALVLASGLGGFYSGCEIIRR